MSYKDGEYLNHKYQADFEEGEVNVSALETRITTLETQMTGLQTVVNSLGLDVGPYESIETSGSQSFVPADMPVEIDLAATTTTNFSSSGTLITCNTTGTYLISFSMSGRRGASSGFPPRLTYSGKVNGTAVVVQPFTARFSDDTQNVTFSGVYDFNGGDTIAIELNYTDADTANYDVTTGSVSFAPLSIA